VIAAAAIALLVALVVFVGWAVVEYDSLSNAIRNPPQVQRQAEQQLSPSQPSSSGPAPEYVLIVGLDREPGADARRSDTMILARVDQANGTLGLLSIPRDSRVPIRGHGLSKINEAWEFGGAPLTISTVRDFTGLPVNHYVQIDFAGFSRVVDLMGGIWIDVDQDIRHNDTGALQIRKGYQALNGKQALQYARSRRFADGDFTRTRHHRTILKALVQQGLSPSNAVRMPAMARAVASNLKSDMSLAQLISMAAGLRAIAEPDIMPYVVPGHTETIGTSSYVIPDMDQAKVVFEDFLQGRGSTDTQ
jgi:LCP family protein required for cell wall assembly